MPTPWDRKQATKIYSVTFKVWEGESSRVNLSTKTKIQQHIFSQAPIMYQILSCFILKFKQNYDCVLRPERWNNKASTEPHLTRNLKVILKAEWVQYPDISKQTGHFPLTWWISTSIVNKNYYLNIQNHVWNTLWISSELPKGLSPEMF